MSVEDILEHVARLLFHSDGITERGTSTSIVGYMKFLINEGHHIIWASEDTPANNKAIIEKYSKTFQIDIYKDFKKYSQSANKNSDWAYFMKKGPNDGKIIPRVPCNVHAVFKYYEPHGDSYAYISEWLASSSASLAIPLIPKKLKNRIPNPFLKLDWVPYGVDVEQSTKTLRANWGIPEEAKVILRYGGNNTFDIPWVLEEIVWQLQENPNLYFVGVNTMKFTDHPRAIFLPPIYSNHAKANMLASADIILHARLQGESFGMVILEAMQASRDILAWSGGWDRNHTKLLDNRSLYVNRKDLRFKLSKKRANETILKNLEMANNFRIANVMPKFKEVFGSGIL